MFDYRAKRAPYVRLGNWPAFDILPLRHIGNRTHDGSGDNWTRFTKDECYQILNTLR